MRGKEALTRILLVNPWIADVAAHNFWVRPLGLYALAEWLWERGAEPALVDCVSPAPAPGKFRRERVLQPSPLAAFPRRFARYGISVAEFRARVEAARPFQAVLLTSAASLWQAAEQRVAAPPPAATSRPGQATKEVARTTPNPKPAVEPTPAAVEPEPESDSLQVVRYYRSLESAIRTRQLSEIRTLLPNMTDNEEKYWRNLFNEKNLTAVEAVYTVRSVTREGDGATARILLDLTLTKKDKFEHRERQERATLTLGQQGWRQVSAQRIQ